MNRVSNLIHLVEAHLAGDRMATTVLKSADYQQVLRELAADAARWDSDEGLVRDASNRPAELVEFLVRGEEPDARSALSMLRNWLRGADNVTVCDPYFFMAPTRLSIFRHVNDYADQICRLFDPSTKRIRVFCHGFETSVKRALYLKLKDGRSVEVFDTPAIHDRFFIRDGHDAKLIGASLQGIGSRLFAIVDLPQKDLEELSAELRVIAGQAPKPWA